MIKNIGLYNLNKTNGINFSAKHTKKVSAPSVSQLGYVLGNTPVTKANVPVLNQVQTKLSSEGDIKMYDELLNAFTTSKTEKQSPQDNILRQKKLDALLKSGTLLNKNSNTGASTLQSRLLS